jgi:hypothetical protein
MYYVRRFLIPKIPEKYLKLPKKEILMAYISRSCDLFRDGDSKNRKFDGLCKQYFCSKNTKNIQKIDKYSPKGNSDG